MGTVILPPSPNWYASHLADVGPGLHAFCAHNSIVVLDSGGTQVCDVLKGHSNRTTAVAFVHDDDDPTALWIVSASSDKTVKLWICTNMQLGTFSCRRSLGKRPAEVKAIAATSRVAVVGDTAGNLFIWHVATSPERMQRLENCHQRSSITCLACCPRPEHPVAAVGCANGEVAFINWEQGIVLSVLRHHSVEVHCLRWSHVGIEDINQMENTNTVTTTGVEDKESCLQLPKSVELLVSAAPGERLRIYETCSVGAGACACASTSNNINTTNNGRDDTVVCSLGEGREITLVSTLQHPKPPGNLAHGQRQRLWLSADWLPAPAVRRRSNGTIDLWMLTSGYGGGILARRVLLQCEKSFENGSLVRAAAEKTQAGFDASKALTKVEVEEAPPVRLPGGHSRTVFSVRCMLDLSREEPGVRILTIGMDRAAMAFWAPVPRLHRNFYLEAEEKNSRQNFSSSSSSLGVPNGNASAAAGAALVDSDSGMSAACEAERKSWQRTELVGSITGLGSFPQALSISPRKLCFQHSSSGLPQLQPKLAVGCGDGSLRILPFQQTEVEAPENTTTTKLQQGISTHIRVSIELDTQASTLIWQGIPAPVTAVLWHPTEDTILAFGCSDGSVGLAHSGKGTTILAMSKHKAGISHIAWVLEGENKEQEENFGNNSNSVGKVIETEKHDDDDEEKEEEEKEEKSSKSFRLLTLSSDGSLFQWNAWPGSSLSDLFPAQTKQQQQQGAAAAVTARTELGRPSLFPLSFSPLKQGILETKGDICPTCLDPGEGGVDTVVVGCVDGNIIKLKQGGGCIVENNLSENILLGRQEKEQPATAGKTAAVAYVATYGHFYACFHTDKTLVIGDFSGLQLKTPLGINIADTVTTSVTSMALVTKEVKNATFDKQEEQAQSPNIESSLSLPVYIALGLQDGTIQIWGLDNNTTNLEEKHAGREGAETKEETANKDQIRPEKQQTEHDLALLTVLRGHAGPVVSLEWITALSSSSLQNNKDKETSVFLFSGSEDQSVRKWDLAKIVKKQQEKQEKQENISLIAEEDKYLTGNVSCSVATIASEKKNEENVPPPPPAAAPDVFSEEIISKEETVKVEGKEKESPEITKISALPASAAAKIQGAPSSSFPANENKNRSGSGSHPSTSTSIPLAAHQVSLGSKGLLPPSLPRAETSIEQAPLDAALLALASRIASSSAAAGGSGSGAASVFNPQVVGVGLKEVEKEEDEADYFATLGCIIDPLSAMPALHHASNSLLSGPSQRPAAARVLAQRAAAVSLWSGDVGSAINILVENDALTADFVSFSAAAGRGAWEAASRAYAYLLEERGEPHLAALHLASIGDPISACRVYTRAGMAREATTLAVAKLPPRHPLVLETRAVYASQLEGRLDFERAAAQYIASENWKKAVEMLQKRGTLDALQTALEILSIVKLRQKEQQENVDTIAVDAREETQENAFEYVSFVKDELEEFKQALQANLSALKLEKKLDTASVSLEFKEMSARDIRDQSQKRRYSTKAFEEIKEEMAKRSDDWNGRFKLVASKKFPNLSALLKDSS